MDIGANLTFGLASNAGLLTLAAAAGSLYPVATVLLARFVHHERLARIQQVGVVLALAGVALIAAA
jgi:drug/metabolite transporter (DMT)-like permease